MEARRITHGYFALLCAVAMGVFVPSALGSSSIGGPPGRSDFVPRRNSSDKSDAKQKAPVVQPAAPEVPPPRAKFVWNVPANRGEPSASAASSSLEAKTEASPTPSAKETTRGTVSEAAADRSVAAAADSPLPAPLTFSSPAARAAAYEQVLTAQQRLALRDRALAYSLSPRDYEHLLSDEEKTHIEAEIITRKRRLATQE